MRPTSLALKGLTLRRLSDGDVFERALEGDAAAFSEFYRRFRTAVYGYCLARLMSAADAEDATHETFLRVLDARPGSVSSPRAWLFGVARNVCVDTIRARTRVEPTDLEEAGLGLLSASTDRVAEGRDDARAALIALRRMRPRYRTALIMREVIGESNEHLAESLGISVATAHTLVSRARDSFGREFAAVRDLPPACRDAVRLLYKRVGTGLSTEEHGRLDAHLESCPGCAIEARRIRPDRKLPAFVPLTALGSLGRLGVLGQATQIAAGTGAVAGAGATTSTAIKLAIAAAVTTAVVVPVAVQQATEQTATEPRTTVSSPAKTQATAGGLTAEEERAQSREAVSAGTSTGGAATDSGDAGPHGAVDGSASGATDGTGSGGTAGGTRAGATSSGGSGGTSAGQDSGGSGGSTSGGSTAGGTGGTTTGGTSGSGTSGGTQGGSGSGTGAGAPQDPGTGGTGSGSGAGAPGGATDTGGNTGGGAGGSSGQRGGVSGS